VLSILSRRIGLKVHPWRASVWINLASYICLILIASATGRYGGALNLKSRTVWSKMTRSMPTFDLWYVKPDGRKIERMQMEPFQPGKKRVFEEFEDPTWPQMDPDSRDVLAVVTSPTGVRYLKWLSSTPADSPTLIKRFNPDATLERTGESGGWKAPNTHVMGPSRSLQKEKTPSYAVASFLWPGYDFEVTDNQKREQFSFGLETPFFHWQWRNLIQLPDDWCIAEKDGRIYLVDLRNREIGLLTFGFGASAVLPGNLK
jgi:hypothetical protein